MRLVAVSVIAVGFVLLRRLFLVVEVEHDVNEEVAEIRSTPPVDETIVHVDEFHDGPVLTGDG